MTALPPGFSAHVDGIGIKDDTDDFLVLAADRTGPAAAVFTRSRFVGPSVTLSRANVADGRLRAVVVVSKNANVATGEQGARDAAELAAGVAAALGCDATDVLVASTGVIGRPYPMDRVRKKLETLALPFDVVDAEPAATAMMTTDTVAKVASANVLTRDGGQASIVGMAKGVGMVEPDMATLLAFFLTDADLGADELDAAFRRVIDRSLNAVSIDTDTSTSDTAAILTSSAAGPVDLAAFEQALGEVALSLTRQIARDGEGATKLIHVRVAGAARPDDALNAARTVALSMLVRTAVAGGDPNWGRILAALGRSGARFDLARVRVAADSVALFADGAPLPITPAQRAAIFKSSHVSIEIDLGAGVHADEFFTCDLTEEYVRVNAEYTT